MKKPQLFYRLKPDGSKRTTPEEDELLDLCELIGNQEEGVSSLELGKRLRHNGVSTINQFRNCTIDDISNFHGVGQKRIEVFIKMKEYIERN